MPVEREVEATSAASSSEAVFKLLYPELRRFAAVVASADIDPDDLVQEALAKVVQNGNLAELDNPAAYLRQSILNLERSHRRRWARWRQRAHRAEGLPLTVEHSYPSDLAILDSLSPFERTLIYLTAVEGLPYSAVVELLGGNEKTMRSRSSKVRQRLRAALAKADEQ